MTIEDLNPYLSVAVPIDFPPLRGVREITRAKAVSAWRRRIMRLEKPKREGSVT